MEKIGSLAKLVYASAVRDWSNKLQVEKSEMSQVHVKGLENTLQAFKIVAKTNDIDLILQAEFTQLQLEKIHYEEKDPSVLPSLTAALVDFSVINKSLGTVRSNAYHRVADAHHVKRKIQGVPVDGFHEAVNSHATRLGNQLRTIGLSVPEKNIVRQRQANMRVAKELYIGLQCEVLGIEQPKKAKGLER